MDLSFSQSDLGNTVSEPQPKSADLLSDTFARFGLNIDLLGKDENSLHKINNNRIEYCIITEADLIEEWNF